MGGYRFYKPELPTDIIEIKTKLEEYYKLIKDICKSDIGKYTPHHICDIVEELLTFLETNYTPIKTWTIEYLKKHRGELWLYYGIQEGNKTFDHWETHKSFDELQTTWPFLFGHGNREYKEYIVDLLGAKREFARQKKRQETPNPNYKPFHPDGCSRGCSCWMLDDMEQWYTEERQEIEASKNIFFNNKLQLDFFKTALQDLESIKEQWVTWEPESPKKEVRKNTDELPQGVTIIKLVLSWVKKDIDYWSILDMFHLSGCFEGVWENIDLIPEFVRTQREKLKKMRDLL